MKIYKVRSKASVWRGSIQPALGTVALSCLLLSACPAANGDPAARPPGAIESIRTDLKGDACREEIDKDDPNETPYLLCPGVSGYALIVRHADAGRQSIDVVDPAQRLFPLNYDEFVTRYMSNLHGKAEWRVTARDGKRVPIALIVRVQAREDIHSPEKVTRTYLAVAKITANEVCVTDRIPEGAKAEGAVRRAADSAEERPCAPPLPHMIIDGAVVR